MTEYIFRISSRHPEPVNPHRAWLEQARGKVICPECGRPLASYYPTPVDVALRELAEDICTGVVDQTKISLFSKSFLSRLGEHLQGFIVGDCYWADGSRAQTHNTCYSSEYVLLRSDAGADFWTCSTCHNHYSYVDPRHPAYVLRSDLKGRMVTADQAGRLLIPQQIARLLDSGSFPDLDVRRIEVRD